MEGLCPLSMGAANTKQQTLRPAQGRAVTIGRRVLEEPRVNQSRGERGEGCLRFELGERGAQAIMRAAAKAKMLAVSPVRIKALRMDKAPWVAIACGK